MKVNRTAFFLFSLIIAGLIFIVIEIAVRVLFPEIILQGIKKDFFTPKIYGSSFSFKPDIEGTIWGKKFKTNELGFPIVSDKPVLEADSKIIILGDSLSFPVGVNYNEGFPNILESRLPNYRIINASLPGYWVGDYYNVLDNLLKRLDFKGVIVSICLNDFVDVSQVDIKNNTFERDRFINNMSGNPAKRLMLKLGYSRFLTQHSKAYALLKNILFDPGRMFFEADMLEYNKPAAAELISRKLIKLNSLAVENKKWIMFLVFPYRVQFKNNNMEAQELLSQIANKNSLYLIDMYPFIKEQTVKAGIAPDELYLKFDTMHFSPKGHRIIGEVIFNALKSGPLSEEI